MLQNKIEIGDKDRLLAEAFLKMKKPVSLKTLERRLRTPYEKIAPEKISVFGLVLKVKTSELQNPNLFFFFDGKKWVKEERRVEA